MRRRVTVDNKHRDRHEKNHWHRDAGCGHAHFQWDCFLVFTLSFLTPLLDLKLLRDHNNEHKVFNPS
jgi:hypothetical protein